MAPLRTATYLLFLSALLPGTGCSFGPQGSDDGSTISREAFVDVLFDLRVAALQTSGQEITLEEKDRILEAHGLTEEDVLRFAEVRGGDPEFMEGVWAELRARLQDSRMELSGEEPGEDVEEEIRGIMDDRRGGES